MDVRIRMADSTRPGFVSFAGQPSEPLMDPTTLFNIIGLAGTIAGTFISVFAFVVSLRFYREGKDLTEAANRALTQLAERAGATHSTVETIQTRLLDAVIEARQVLTRPEQPLPPEPVAPAEGSQNVDWEDLYREQEDYIYSLKRENEELEKRIDEVLLNLASQSLVSGELINDEITILRILYPGTSLDEAKFMEFALA
jgi:hypothetical protein